ncbi:MAG TPA: copper chaperone PCu(A)C [Anaerolineales bacterium]|nr:copper chaperone PCu(A)C [Anaerolineales bacterium]
MKKKSIVLFSMFLLVAACAPKEGIEIRDAWIRSAPQGGNSALYFVIHNYSADDELVGVSTEVARAAEMHESSMVNDVMQMRMVESVPLVSGEDVVFESGGLHVMLVGLKEEAKIGDMVDIVLHFKNSEDIRLQVPVQEGAEEHDGHGG